MVLYPCEDKLAGLSAKAELATTPRPALVRTPSQACFPPGTAPPTQTLQHSGTMQSVDLVQGMPRPSQAIEGQQLAPQNPPPRRAVQGQLPGQATDPKQAMWSHGQAGLPNSVQNPNPNQTVQGHRQVGLPNRVRNPNPNQAMQSQGQAGLPNSVQNPILGQATQSQGQAGLLNSVQDPIRGQAAQSQGQAGLLNSVQDPIRAGLLTSVQNPTQSVQGMLQNAIPEQASQHASLGTLPATPHMEASHGNQGSPTSSLGQPTPNSGGASPGNTSQPASQLGTDFSAGLGKVCLCSLGKRLCV